MASEAIGKVKAAEDKGNEIIRSAAEAAKEMLKKAEKEGVEKKNEIIRESVKTGKEMVAAALKEAEKECEPFLKGSEKELAGIKNPNKDILRKTIGLCVERIVNV